MFFYEGLSCPICQKPFAHGEDVVACPDCGLPHHRECWISEGHCHLQHLHGTDEQWSRNRSTRTTVTPADEPTEKNPVQSCPRCHTKNPEYAEVCTHCGMLLHPQSDWSSASSAGYSEYRPFHTASPFAREQAQSDEEIDGVRVDDLVATVGVKTEYYLPRFRRMARGNRASWNWAAFLLTPYWLLFRKMYGYGIAMLLLQLLESGLMYVIYNILGITATMDYAAQTQTFMAAMQSESVLYYMLSLSLFSGLLFFLKILIALFGNRLYQRHCGKLIRRAREKTPDLTAGELATIGGTSMAVAIIGYSIVYFITQMIGLLLL